MGKIFLTGPNKDKKLKMSELNYENVSKMKVAELRSALEDHGLDSKGTKPILVARLQSYMENQPSQNSEPEPMQLESTEPEAKKHKLSNTNIEEMAEETSPAKKAKFDDIEGSQQPLNGMMKMEEKEKKCWNCD